MKFESPRTPSPHRWAALAALTALLLVTLVSCTVPTSSGPTEPTENRTSSQPSQSSSVTPPGQLPAPFNDVTTGWSLAHAQDNTLFLVNPETGERFEAGTVVGVSPENEKRGEAEGPQPGWVLADVSASGQRALFIDYATNDLLVYDLVQRRELAKMSPGEHLGAIFTRPEADAVLISKEKQFERRSIADGQVTTLSSPSNKAGLTLTPLPGGSAVIDARLDGPWLIRNSSTGELIREVTPPDPEKWNCVASSWLSETQVGVSCDPAAEGQPQTLVLGIEEGRFYRLDLPANPSPDAVWRGVYGGGGEATVLTASADCNVTNLAVGDLNNLKAAEPISMKAENVAAGPYLIAGVGGGWIVAQTASGCHGSAGASELISYRLDSKKAKLLIDSKTSLRQVVMVYGVEV